MTNEDKYANSSIKRCSSKLAKNKILQSKEMDSVACHQN